MNLQRLQRNGGICKPSGGLDQRSRRPSPTSSPPNRKPGTRMLLRACASTKPPSLDEAEPHDHAATTASTTSCPFSGSRLDLWRKPCDPWHGRTTELSPWNQRATALREPSLHPRKAWVRPHRCSRTIKPLPLSSRISRKRWQPIRAFGSQ